jgi:hypothetical protein
VKSYNGARLLAFVVGYVTARTFRVFGTWLVGFLLGDALLHFLTDVSADASGGFLDLIESEFAGGQLLLKLLSILANQGVNEGIALRCVGHGRLQNEWDFPVIRHIMPFALNLIRTPRAGREIDR